ncbi:hypothetical protein SSX86_007785 [Deinandra increscens subsp. villosa]|uniref:AIG1-type G domain-containing protein n=1 Tax=Deinandra increscens subsp. villosa TaxID=3103831 RepID=A0AAP0DFB7_9ASTR
MEEIAYVVEGDCEFSSAQTIVLVGRKGNGKSATGNSILGTNIFRSARSSSGVTSVCELISTNLEDGRKINVIDTPGISSSLSTDFTAKEIIKCIDMAENGIDAFLVVFSVRNRFSTEEEAAVSSLLACFGRKIYDYMILVFTGGDQLDEGETLEAFLHDCPEKLKETINLCENRCVLFDNKTEDQTKRSDQVEKLFSTINLVSRKNGGKPYNNEMFTEWKKEARELEKQAEISQASKEPKWSTKLEIFEMIEPKLKETTMILERQLAEEHAARLKAEEDAKATQKKSNEQILDIKEKIEMAKRRRQKGPMILDFFMNHLCVIL